MKQVAVIIVGTALVALTLLRWSMLVAVVGCVVLAYGMTAYEYKRD